MTDNRCIISQDQLNQIGVTSEEIEAAGGLEAIAHIVWFFQNATDYSEHDIDDAIANAIAKKREEEELKKSFEDIHTNCDDENDDTQILHNNETINDYLLNQKPVIGGVVDTDNTLTIKKIYTQSWGKNPHPALKLLIEAYFIDTQDMIPDADDKKEVLKTIRLLRSYIAGKELPIDAEDERLIVYARDMYKEFLDTKSDYDNCPMLFILDEAYDDLPEKHRMLAQSLPVSAILKIFAENCFYDSQTHTIDEALPEEINIKNLCEMIEKLAIILKIWQ